MFALDLFNNDHERRLTEGAVDTLEQRRIDDLAMKMDDLVARARKATDPEHKAALVREFKKVKDERDSYFKVRTETMGYGGLVGEAGIPGNVPADKIPGKEDLLKGKGRSYYESVEEGNPSKKVFKDKAGKPVGEIGIDSESSPGNGEWYVYHYGTGYSVVGFDSAAEAKRELMYVHKHPEAVEGHESTFDEAGIPGSVPTEKIPGKEDLLKGKGRSYYEAQDQKKNSEVTEGQRLAVGDPIIVTAPNEFKGKTGEISEFSPSGKFVVVDLYNHGKHSMHLSDIEFNQYAADQDDVEGWEDDYHDEYYADLKEVGVDEGFQDFNKVEPYAVCLAGKPVKQFDYYEQARRFHDNWKQKLYREGNQAKADTITLLPLNLDEAMNVNDLLNKVTKDSNKNFKKAKAGKLKASGDFTKGDHWTGPDKDDPSYTKNFGHGYPDTPSNRSHDRYVKKSLKKGVAEVSNKTLQNYKDKAVPAFYKAADQSDVKTANKRGQGISKASHKQAACTGGSYAVAEADETSWTANSAQFRKEEDMSWPVEITLEPNADINQGRGRQVKTMTVTGQSRDAAKKKLVDYFLKNGWTVTGIKFTGDLDEQGVAEVATDYSKRRQREKDVDAGKPVARQRQSKMTDYQKRRAQQKREMELGEDQDTSGVESAIIRRIMVAHTDLLKQFGPEKVMQAAEEVAYNVGNVDEIGTSDVSAYVAQVRQILGA